MVAARRTPIRPEGRSQACMGLAGDMAMQLVRGRPSDGAVTFFFTRFITAA